MARGKLREEFKRWWKVLLGLYLVLLVASQVHLRQRTEPDPLLGSGKKVLEVEGKRLAYLEWGDPARSGAPLILLHGSPGRGAGDFRKLAEQLAESGRWIIAIDRWGFGASERPVDDYSFEADAAAVIALMDQLGMKVAHVGGWSYGGGPALLLGERHPDRIRSVSMIAAIGIQEGEGSGSYMIEHAKYNVGLALAVGLPEVIPHFGLLGPRSQRYSFAKDFVDCDQRPLKSSLTTLPLPLFIIHGKHDPLVPAWVAQEHHNLNPRSRLVLLDGSHFFPMGVGEPQSIKLAVDELSTFLTAADSGTAADLYGERNESGRKNMRAVWEGGPVLRGYKPWWMVAMAGIAIGLVIPRTGGVLAGLAGGFLILDFATVVGAMVLGGVIRRGESRTRVHRALVIFLCSVLAAIPAALLFPFL